MRKLLALYLLSYSESFILKYRPKLRGAPLYNLKKIDDELGRLRTKTGALLRQKQQILKEKTGMNFHNDSDIEAHLNRTFSKPFDEDQDEYEEDEEDEINEKENVRVIIMNGFNPRTGNKNPFLDMDSDDASDSKSENFEVSP